MIKKSVLKISQFKKMGFDTHFEPANSFTESDMDW